MPVGHVIVCGHTPVAPFGYFIRCALLAERWLSESPDDDRSWCGSVFAVRLRGEPAGDLDAGMRTNLEGLAQRNVGFVIWIDGAADDPEGFQIVKGLAHEIALDTGGALISLRDRAVLDLPPLGEVEAARQATLEALVDVDRAIDALKSGDVAPLSRLVDAVLEDAAQGHRRPASIVAHELIGPVYGGGGDGDEEAAAGFTGDTLRAAAEQLARLARAIDSGRASALYPTLRRAQARLGGEPSSIIAEALADREQQDVVHRAKAWAEDNPPSRANVTTILNAACIGDMDAIAKVYAWAFRFPADPPVPLSRAEMHERLAFVGPFCSAVRAAPALHPEIWGLANAVMGSKLVESGGTLAALRTKLPKESGA